MVRSFLKKLDLDITSPSNTVLIFVTFCRMNRRKADFKFQYKFLEDDL